MSSLLSTPAVAVVFAVFIWWFSTGVVLLLNGLHRRARRRSLALSTLLALLALWALQHSAQQLSVANVYCAFTSALLVWGWHELSFLTGWVTGPRTSAQDVGAQGWQRFGQALRAVLWHELALVAVGGLIVALTWGAPNPVGTWTFLVLWVMRISAKFNLFLGVRNLSEALLPPHLSYLQSFFKRRAMNPLLPLSVLAGGAVLAALVWHAQQPAVDAVGALGLTLVGTMLALAILEHLMLVLPLDPTALWHWALGARRTAAPPPSSQDTHEKYLHAR